ncbi:MAG: hypothetical protein Q4A61_07015, partial [Porphyromonadaceae bacterium]|nr:hypothetical protein [Porphyromonadaceae bacterium]
NLRELSKKTSRTFSKKIGNSEKKVREVFFEYSRAFFRHIWITVAGVDTKGLEMMWECRLLEVIFLQSKAL